MRWDSTELVKVKLPRHRSGHICCCHHWWGCWWGGGSSRARASQVIRGIDKMKYSTLSGHLHNNLFFPFPHTIWEFRDYQEGVQAVPFSTAHPGHKVQSQARNYLWYEAHCGGIMTRGQWQGRKQINTHSIRLLSSAAARTLINHPVDCSSGTQR